MISESDCLLVIGCKLGEIATKRYTVPEPGKVLIHLECVAEEIGRTYAPTVPLWGDVKAGIADLDVAMKALGSNAASRADWVRAGAGPHGGLARECTRSGWESEETPVGMGRLMGELNKILADDAILIADGGFAAHWGGLLYDSKKPGRGFVPDRGFASIG